MLLYRGCYVGFLNYVCGCVEKKSLPIEIVHYSVKCKNSADFSRIAGCSGFQKIRLILTVQIVFVI